MSSDFEIKPASEVPDKGRNVTIYPFGDMAVGTAFVVPPDHPGAHRSNGRDSRAAMAARQYGHRYGVKLRTSNQPDGSVRIERVK